VAIYILIKVKAKNLRTIRRCENRLYTPLKWPAKYRAYS